MRQVRNCIMKTVFMFGTIIVVMKTYSNVILSPTQTNRSCIQCW